MHRNAAMALALESGSHDIGHTLLALNIDEVRHGYLPPFPLVGAAAPTAGAVAAAHTREPAPPVALIIFWERPSPSCFPLIGLRGQMQPTAPAALFNCLGKPIGSPFSCSSTRKAERLPLRIAGSAAFATNPASPFMLFCNFTRSKRYQRLFSVALFHFSLNTRARFPRSSIRRLSPLFRMPTSHEAPHVSKSHR